MDEKIVKGRCPYHFGHIISLHVRRFLLNKEKAEVATPETQKLALYVIETVSPLFFNLKTWINNNDKILMCCMNALTFGEIDRLLKDLEMARKNRKNQCMAFGIMSGSAHELLR
ncbi:hypothetical protein M951_chr3162 (nucleomorph) [Lotharella oceanica]|uniref:Uncharacterized protein n=1 Tax=Lotharella oceanica TaxID=641309 RepID=A0A060DHG0_9EUKA|nr:hypothetical protein M951_chr143 [Lotharella oceanica]AIB09667.1 hypothetical protein M951_chr1188 [Lotharella oceanica]AIB09746.1 hypothetical protein M951_chr243 [Lotharella oceanica]AIB09870.1 hypothetical protein M951_chr2178 [Lotharella oceanica]AIB09949.1 hypothetical protein M951_chr343 [Lotharella oceanica]